MLRTLFWAAAVCTVLAPACGPMPEPPGTGSATADSSQAPAGTPGAGQAPSRDEAALRELSDRFVRGARAANADTLASVYSVRAEVFAPGAKELLLGQSAIRDHYAHWLQEDGVRDFDVRRSEYVVRGDLAYSFGVWHATLQLADAAAPLAVTGHVTDVYRRERSGVWVVAHEHASLLPSGTEPPPPDSTAVRDGAGRSPVEAPPAKGAPPAPEKRPRG